MQSTKPLIPVTVLTGALGAGKTTLLNAVLRQVIAPNQRLAIIVNEFGAVGIDDVLVQSSSEEVVLLPGGCVCCAVRSDLVQAILQLERAVHRGEMPAFNRIVIETSGLAEPAPILQLFAESPALQGRFRLDAVVTVVDALLGEAALQSESTAWRQVLLADRLIINKCALQSAVALDALHARLSEINPQAECVRLMQPAHIQVNDFQQPDLPQGQRVDPKTLRTQHDDQTRSFVLAWETPSSMTTMGDWLHAITTQHGARLLRVKGIVAVAEIPFAVALHAIQHLVGAPDVLQCPPPTRSRVVMIVRGLEPEDVLPPWTVQVEALSS